MSTEILKAGSIVNFRNRLWRIEDSDGIEFEAVPLSGNDFDKHTFLVDLEDVKAENLAAITPERVGDFATQRLLLRAYQFDLIHGSAPFLSLHRSSVVPYNYQLVPLIMAMERPTSRILIGDEVGLGKSIEAGLIISELMQRGKVKRVLVLVPASLKQQWKETFEYFFHINPTIIDSYSRKEFEKELPVGANPWAHFNIVIASIDYAKAPDIHQQITEHNWDLLLVDEIHLSAKPHSNSKSTKQMRRYELVKDLGGRIANVLFLTATPHNGYSDSFASILEILNPKVVQHKADGEIKFKKKEARFNVIQRDRVKLEKWYSSNNVKSPFPKRDQSEVIISPKQGSKMMQLLDAVEQYGDFILSGDGNSEIKNIASWVALHLQKRVISSPYALFRSIENRIYNLSNASTKDAETSDSLESSIFDLFGENDRNADDSASISLDFEALNENEIGELKRILDAEKAFKPKDDFKLQELKTNVIPELLAHDPKVIVFTKYKDTLDYLEKNLKSKDYDVISIHGGLSATARVDVFSAFERSKSAVLVATDVIAEGLNLQRLAASVVHNELPWNPNRLEQRNGRVDRIGQKMDFVKIRTLVLDKSLDKQILDLLLEQQKTIELDRDYSAAFFGDEDTLKALVAEATSKRRNKRIEENPNQLGLFDSQGYNKTRDAVKKSISAGNDEKTRKKRIQRESFYDSLDIELPEIDRRIEETKRIVGSQEEVLKFVSAGLGCFKSALNKKTGGFYEMILNDPRLILPQYGAKLPKVTFDPELALTNPDAIILDAGHPLVRKLIQLVKSTFFSNDDLYGRTAYYISSDVNSVAYKFTYLVRFTAGLKEKRVIEELISFSIHALDEKEITNDPLPINTTTQIGVDEITQHITDALSIKGLESIITKKMTDRRMEIIHERQELYKKILVDSSNANQPDWLDEMVHIDHAGNDLLSVTVVIPNLA